MSRTLADKIALILVDPFATDEDKVKYALKECRAFQKNNKPRALTETTVERQSRVFKILGKSEMTQMQITKIYNERHGQDDLTYDMKINIALRRLMAEGKIKRRKGPKLKGKHGGLYHYSIKDKKS